MTPAARRTADEGRTDSGDGTFTRGVSRVAFEWAWLAQLGLLTAYGAAALLVPRRAIALLTGDGADVPRLEVDLVRSTGAAFLVLDLATLLALMRLRDPGLRRALARAFCAFFVAWSTVVAINHQSGHFIGWVPYLTFIPGYVLALLNLQIARRPWTEGERELAWIRPGSANAKPPQAWPLWLVQGLGLSALAVLLLAAPARGLAWLTGLGSDALPPRALEEARVLGACFLGSALVTFTAMAQQVWITWRELAMTFAVTLAAWAGAFTWGHASGSFALGPWLVLAGFALLLAAGNLALVRLRDPWADEDVEVDTEDWTFTDLVAGPMMGLQTLMTKRRASHLVGVGARGRFVAEPDASVPANDFLVPGTEWPLQARFANLTELDDASLDVRGGSIKLSLHPWKSPFDLLMNTGSFCPAGNVVEFAAFVASKFMPTIGSEIIVKSNPNALEGGVAGLRRGPDSFARLYFHAQKPSYWVSTDNVRYLVRWRMAPWDLGRESGLPDDADCSHVWIRARRHGDTRPASYLREELKARLARGPVAFRLQAQFHRPEAGDGLAWYDASVEWDGLDHPWLDVGRVELLEPLPPAVTERLQFNPANHPPSLPIPVGASLMDPRSLGSSEYRVVRRLQRLRLWMYDTFGLPPLDGAGS